MEYTYDIYRELSYIYNQLGSIDDRLHYLSYIGELSTLEKIGIIAGIISSVVSVIALIISLKAYFRTRWQNWLSIREVAPQLDYDTPTGKIPKYIKLYVCTEKKHKEVPIKINRAVVYISGISMLFHNPKSDERDSHIWFSLVYWANISDHKIYEKMTIDDFCNEYLNKTTDFDDAEILLETNIGQYHRKLSKKEVYMFQNFFKDIKENKK